MENFGHIKTSFGRRKIYIYIHTCIDLTEVAQAIHINTSYNSRDEWGNFGHIKTSFGRRKIVVYTTCDGWEKFGHRKTSSRSRKIVVYTTYDQFDQS